MGRDPPGEDDRLETNLNTVVPWRVLELDLLRNEPGCRQGDRRRLLGPDKRRVPIVGRLHDRTVYLDGGVENTQVVARQRHDLDRRRTDFGWTKPGRVEGRRARTAGGSEGEGPQDNKRGTRGADHVQV